MKSISLHNANYTTIRHIARYLTFLFLLIGNHLLCHASADSLGHYLQKQRQLFPQEKIYLHTDRSSYAAGDTIWFRAHLVDAATHQVSTNSRYVYVELIDPDSKLLKRIKLRPSNKIFQGHIAIGNMLPQGYYTLRAYTRFMENLPESYFFHSTIAITNPIGANRNKAKSTPTNVSTTTAHTAFDVSFYPEGGYLPAGVSWRVAFKGINQDGWSDQVYGHVLERSTGDTVATLQHSHRGMGVFMLKAEKGKEYVAKCINSQNRYAEFELPSPIEDVPMLSAHWVRERLGITLSAPQTEGLRLVMHTRGMVFYNQPWNPIHSTLFVSQMQLPIGVIQILLIDKNENILSERLVYNNSPQALQTTLHSNKSEYGRREEVNIEALLNTQESKVQKGNFSVSVAHQEDVNATSTASIHTYLLLTSELRGVIELPETYFEPNDKRAQQHLDLLMLTQGWRRYNIHQVAKGKYHQPKYSHEIGQEIHGQVISEYNHRPQPNARVLMILTNPRFYEEKESDSLGRFSFTHMEFPDSTKYIIRALNKKGKSHDVKLKIREESYPQIPTYASASKLFNRSDVEAELNIKALSDTTIRLIELQGVEVTASYKRPKTPIGFMPNANTTTLDENYYKKKQVYDMYDLLNSTPYVTCYNNEIFVRSSPSNRMGSNMQTIELPPLIMIDNQESTVEQVLSLSSEDVEEVSVVRKVTNSMFDMRGYGSLLLIYTKPGTKITQRFAKVNIGVYKPLGYQRPAAFYSPKYESNNTIRNNIDNRRTLYWNPYVPIGEDGRSQFKFYTGDKKGIYTILVQGISTDGEVIYAKKEIIVK